MRAIGELRRAEELLNEVADRSGDAPSRYAFLEAASLRDYIAATSGSFHELEEASELPPDEAPPEVRARAKIVEAEVRWTTGEYSSMVASLDDAERICEKPEEPEQRTLLNSILAWKARAFLLGPEPAESGLEKCEKIWEDARNRDLHALEASVLGVRAGLRAMREKFDQAREDYRESQRIGEAFGLDAWLAALPLYSGPVELLAGQVGAAGRQLRRGYIALEGMGDRSRRATTAAFLAQALYEQERDDEARKFAWKSKGLAAEADAFTQVVWRGALGKLLARAGDGDGAVQLAQKAVERAEGTEGPNNLQADALLDRAVVLRACDRPGAEESAREALERYTTKENAVGIRRAEDFLEGSSA